MKDKDKFNIRCRIFRIAEILKVTFCYKILQRFKGNQCGYLSYLARKLFISYFTDTSIGLHASPPGYKQKKQQGEPVICTRRKILEH